LRFSFGGMTTSSTLFYGLLSINGYGAEQLSPR
jgi:hypothetical protein